MPPSRAALQSSSSQESTSTAPRCGQVIRGRGGLGLRGRGRGGLRGRGHGYNIRGPPAMPLNSRPRLISSVEGAAEIEKKEVSEAKKSFISIRGHGHGATTTRAKLEYNSRIEMAIAPLGRITTEENKTKVLNLEKGVSSRSDLEAEKRQEGLEKSIDSSNKGYEMLVKMGYKAGETLGKSNTGSSAEPIDVKLKNDRRGLGKHSSEMRGLCLMK